MERFIIEKVAAGLAKVDKPVEAVLVDISLSNGISESDITEDKICGVPLIKVDLTGFMETDDKECPFILVFKNIDYMDTLTFRKGYDGN